MNRIRRALVSVSDKKGVIDLVHGLVQRGIDIISTGGTAKLLTEHGINVIEVADYTGFPEIMGGRVKTLHPKIHGGILGRRSIDDVTMQEHAIAPIDLIIVNLYPFEAAIARDDCDLHEAIENIDIGGPTMLRAAAKNYSSVTVIVNVEDYQPVLDEMDENSGATTEATRFELACKAFEHTARYDGLIANYLGAMAPGKEEKAANFSRSLNLQFNKKQETRYGENAHQRGAFYVDKEKRSGSISAAHQLQGKALSYNNIADTDAALECVKQFDQGQSCVIVKHANPCGVATAITQLEAYNKAYSTDPESAFGGIIAFNSELDGKTAQAILDRQFVEVIIAPQISSEAKEIIAGKQNIRLLESGQWQEERGSRMDYKSVNGGLLVQDTDLLLYDDLKVVSDRSPTDGEMKSLLFAWKVAKFVKSNAIVYARDNMTIGIGAGQMSRVNSARIAAIKAKHANLEVKGAVMASDAFFPFCDGIDRAAEVGIEAVIQPGGSLRDSEVVAAANEHNMAMVFTGMRHFRH